MVDDAPNPYYGIQSSAMQEAFDRTEPLPDWDDAKPPLQSLCERKHITLNDLVRVGARMKDKHGTTLAFTYPYGIKYRDLITGKKWSEWNSEWEHLKIIPGRDHEKVVVVEGETDAARMSGPDGPGWDVAVMAGGAENVYQAYIDALQGYKWVYVATDDDGQWGGRAGGSWWCRKRRSDTSH